MMFDAALQFPQQLIALLSERVVTPMLSAMHMRAVGDPYDITVAVTLAAVQLAVITLVFRPLETFVPAERWTDRSQTRVDRQYTLLMLLGILPLFSYLVMAPLSQFLGGSGNDGVQGLTGVKHWVPWFNDHPVLLFVVYYFVYDFVYYCMHRMQHSVPWWWALHSMHHSQRQMSCWTNDRGSYLDAILQSIILAMVGLAMGVEPSEFALMMLIGELVQNFSHANVRIGFGRVLERLLVGPTFHRLHHMRADPDRPGLHNCNFGQVFSVWDIALGTALYGEKARPTGVSDPVVDADNERGLVRQQWETLKRFWGAFSRRSGWKFGDVSFAANYEPVPSLASVEAGIGAVPPTAIRSLG